jgi:hypothetical protein
MKASEDVEREFFVLERLQRLSKTMPLESLVALELLIKPSQAKRDYFHGREEAKTIIENGLCGSDAAAQKKAQEVANYLLSLRYSEVRALAVGKNPV